MTCPEASLGVIGCSLRPLGPKRAPSATEDEEEVEEIECEESRPQVICILHKWGDEVVVVEEDTTREVKRMRSVVSRVMKRIERQQLIKQMEPLAEENAKLKEAIQLMEKNIQRAQHEQDLAESNARDLEYQKGALSRKLTCTFKQLQSVSEQKQQLKDEVEDAAKGLADDVDQFSKVDGEGQAQ
ncbi:uncharacterized protein [Miscanthus floridulus]|uniref:uncharacterized protein n=1 Tax=Miscanthus floridulus TaxID=154761 RepID=UPI0034597676